jgi:hypothetical protein
LDYRTIAALSLKLAPFAPLGKTRLQTLCHLILAVVSARTVNLSHLACERRGAVRIASTYRRLQRFFQHVRLPQDWAAGLVAQMICAEGRWTLCLDRTCWAIGKTEVNVLVLALVTRRHRVPLMWTQLGWKGNSGAPERIALIERFIAKFGAERIKLLLADREFIGFDWLSYLTQNDIPFVSRMKQGILVCDAEGRLRPLAHHFVRPGARAFGPRRFQATLPARSKGGSGLDLTFHTKTLPTGEKLVLVTNRATLAALTEYRKRWAVECLFGDLKTRGFNLEDTRLRNPRKLDLMIAILALATAWASKTAASLIGSGTLKRKSHGYFAKSWFRTGFDHIRQMLRTDPIKAIKPWPKTSKPQGVV